MTESGFTAGDDLNAGATTESEESANSAEADREAAFDEPVRSSAGNVRGEDALAASPPGDTPLDEEQQGSGESSHEADVAAGYDDADSSDR